MISRRFSIFIAVGITCAAIDIGLMQTLIWGGVNYLIATTLGFMVGLIANFLLHTHVTFNATYSHAALARFLVVVATNYLITLLTVYFFHISIDMALIGKILSLPLVAANGFLLSKHWVYKK